MREGKENNKLDFCQKIYSKNLDNGCQGLYNSPNIENISPKEGSKVKMNSLLSILNLVLIVVIIICGSLSGSVGS